MKHQRNILTILFLLLATLCMAQSKLGVISSPDGEANIRRAPTTNAVIDYVLYNGASVHYQNSGTRGWYAIYNADGYFLGFCSSRLIKPYGSKAKSSAISYWWGTLYASDGYVNVRQRPTRNSPIVCSYSAGTTLKFSGTGTWVKCYDNSSRYLGYVHSSCIYR